ncbi:MAG: amidohydrolase family protein, partial [Candidatus Aminicenantales bacterium]
MSGKIGRLRLSAGIAVLLLAAGSLTASDPKADLAIRNARVWTGDPNRPWAQAVAVAGGRILAVGENDDIGAWVGPSTRVVDGRGAALLPGLIDAHFHLLDLSTTGGEVPLNLRFVAGREELVAILASQAQEVPEGTWIFGEGWDERKWG